MSKTVVLSEVKLALTSISSIIGFCCSATELVLSALLLDWAVSSVLHDEKTQKTIEIERIIHKNRFILKNLLKKAACKNLTRSFNFCVLYSKKRLCCGFKLSHKLVCGAFTFADGGKINFNFRLGARRANDNLGTALKRICKNVGFR